MKVTIIPTYTKEPTAWAGGTTTELYIFPENSSYVARNFLFRLSHATIEVEQSDFTLLKGIKRSLMVLEGELTLTHEGKPPRTLQRLDIEQFIGDWSTKSVGKATDFNLMLSKSANGFLKARKVKRRRLWEEASPLPCQTLAYYILKGKVEVQINQAKYLLEETDLMVMHAENTQQRIRVKALENAEWVAVYITH